MTEAYIPSRSIRLSLFFISGALLAYEIVLIKLFAIQYWHHFAHLIISIALLGFGASGTALFLFGKRAGKSAPTLFFSLPLFFICSVWINFFVTRWISFNPLMLLWQPGEVAKLIGLSLIILIPFFLAAFCVGLGLTVYRKHIFRIYAANLLGSGFGSLVIFLTFLNRSPQELILMISILAGLAALLAGRTVKHRILACGFIIALFPLYAVLLHGTSLPMNPFKDLVQAKAPAGSKIEAERFGPLGLVSVMSGPAFHFLPDLSLNCPYPLPKQKGLFIDGNTAGSINRFSGNPEDLRFMDFRVTSLPYTILKKPEVLIIGSGGGTEILNALVHGAAHISAVEINRDVVRLLRGPYRDYSGDVYGPDRCTIFIEDGRGYLERTGNKFDLIQISLQGSMATGTSGVYSLNENYLITTEALITCLERLNPGGVVSISQWITSPPREGVKLIAMAIDALEAARSGTASRSFIMIRSWQTAAILMKNGVFESDEIDRIKDFCQSRLCDLCYYPAIGIEETNRINKMDQGYFFLAATELLSSEREQFLRDYPFYVHPATDDKPFFSHFFRFEILRKYFSQERQMMIPFLDLGYLLVWIGLLLSGALSMLLILIPLRLAPQRGRGTASIFIYFGSIGLAYILLEISILQQFIRYLHDPVFSAAVVICSFLVYSGIGCIWGERIGSLSGSRMIALLSVIAVVGLIYTVFDSFMEGTLSGLSLGFRMILCSGFILPLALPMGIPFPSALARFRPDQRHLLPWAWGINGFFSVIGTSLAILIAMATGFKSVILLAILLYAIAGGIYVFKLSDSFFTSGRASS